MKSILGFFLTAFLVIFLLNSANSQGVWNFGLQGGLNLDQRGFSYKEGDKTNGTDIDATPQVLSFIIGVKGYIE